MFNVSENSMMGEIGNNNIAQVREVLKGLAITSCRRTPAGITAARSIFTSRYGHGENKVDGQAGKEVHIGNDPWIA